MWPPARSQAAASRLSSTVDERVGVAQVGEPQRAALLGAGRRELDDRVEPAREGGVEARAAVAGEDGDAVERLDPLQQVVGLRVGEAVVRLLHVGALAEQRVRLVEQQHDLGVLGAGEQLRQVLLRLADVLAGDAARSTR